MWWSRHLDIQGDYAIGTKIQSSYQTDCLVAVLDGQNTGRGDGEASGEFVYSDASSGMIPNDPVSLNFLPIDSFCRSNN